MLDIRDETKEKKMNYSQPSLFANWYFASSQVCEALFITKSKKSWNFSDHSREF
jgi:hypothetical protein